MGYFDAPYRPADLTVDSSHSLATNLQLWFAFTSGSGTSAPCLLHSSHDGTLQSGASWASSDIGTVLELDGSSEVDFTTDISRNKTAVSCSAWIKPDSVTGRHFVFYESNSLNSGQTRFGLRIDGGAIECVGRDDDGDSFTIFAQSNTNMVVTGAWQHVVAVFDPTGGGCKVYLDGVDVTTQSDNTGDGFPDTASLNQVVGGIGGNSAFYFDGQIQNLRVWDRAISQQEVTLLHTRPWTASNYDTEALWLSPPASPTLSTASEATALMANCVGWWPLTEGSGSTATDLVGSNNGTLTSGVSWKEAALGTSSEHTHGNDYISTGLDVAGESAVTVSAWVRNDGVGLFGKIVCQSHNANFDMHMAVASNSGLKYYINSTSITANNSDIPPIGTWFHVCAVWQQSSRQEIYVNGKLSASVTADTSVIGSNPHNVFIGGTTARSSRGWDGGIQNVRIWNRALSSSEVALLAERPWIGAAYNETAPLYPPVPSSLTPLDSGNLILTSLEGWWPLTETDNFASGAADISGNSNTGTKSGGVTSEFSEVGTSANFDNTGHIDVGKSFWDSGIVSANAFTFNAWFNVDNNTADHGIFGSWNSAQEALNIWVDVGGTNVSLTAICGDGTTQAITSVNAPIVTTGQWHMGTVIFDGSANTLKVFLDGVYSNQNSSATATLTSAPMGFHIGDDGSGSRTMEGLIQNCRIWSRALSSTEVADIFYSPWLGSAYPSTSTGAPRFLINGLRPLLVNGGLVR